MIDFCVMKASIPEGSSIIALFKINFPINTIEDYSAIIRYEIRSFAETWLDLETVI